MTGSIDWAAMADELDSFRLRDNRRLARSRAMRRRRCTLGDARAVPQRGDHGASRLWQRRLSLFRLSAAGIGRRASRPTSIHRVATIANRWVEALGARPLFPSEHEAFSRSLPRRGTDKADAAAASLRGGDWNALHQDVYGDNVFPLQMAVLLSEPGTDFTGGEFVLAEQRPRMQSRAEVVPLRRGRRRSLSGPRAAGPGQSAAGTAAPCGTASAGSAPGFASPSVIIFHDAR
jgi:hypothetical protein